MKNLKSTKSLVFLSLAFSIVLFGGLIPTLGIFSGGRQSAKASDVNISEYALPTNNSYPEGITSGPDGDLWFTEWQGNKIGQISPSGIITEYALPTMSSEPVHITSGPDGNLWFTEQGANKIGKITPSGNITEYALPIIGSQPFGITSGPDGNLWFTEYSENKIGKITPSGAITEYTVPTANSSPYYIASGPDGNLWFTELNAYTWRVGKITPSGAITEYTVPTAGASLTGIASGPDGNMWFNEGGSIVGKITPSGAITEYILSTYGKSLYGITSGPDGNLWFTEFTGNNIGRVTPSGTFNEYPVPTVSSYLYGITSGPDGNLWFTESGTNKIGVLHLSGVTPTPTFQPQAYVALGDSYSSGEGAPNPHFLPGTDDHTIPNRCHRSTAAYPWLTHRATRNTYPTFVFRACSGARIKDFSSANQERNKGEPAQLSWLNSYTGLVTLTIGGNDVGFGDVMGYCAQRLRDMPSCKSVYNAKVNALIKQIGSTKTTASSKPTTLLSLYAAIGRAASNARVLVVGYPRLFPAKNLPLLCPTGIFLPVPTFFMPSDMKWLNEEAKNLDNAIKTAVDNENKAENSHRFVYVSTYDAFNGHELCTRHPYVNRTLIDTSYNPFKLTHWSFHPNISGQAALAGIVESYAKK